MTRVYTQQKKRATVENFFGIFSPSPRRGEGARGRGGGVTSALLGVAVLNADARRVRELQNYVR